MRARGYLSLQTRRFLAQPLLTSIHCLVAWPFYVLRCSVWNGTRADVFPSSHCGLGLLRTHEPADDARKRKLRSKGRGCSSPPGSRHHRTTQTRAAPVGSFSASRPGSALLCPSAALHPLPPVARFCSPGHPSIPMEPKLKPGFRGRGLVSPREGAG